MQPNSVNENPIPVPPSSNQPQPDYGFLADQPKKKFSLPININTFKGKLLVIGVVTIILLIIIFIIRSIVSTIPFSTSDYLAVVERQQQILHIVSVDVTSQTSGQLSTANQDFTSTTQLVIQTAQYKTMTYLYDYKYKPSSSIISNYYSRTIDQELSNSLSTNSFDSTFKSVMKNQLNEYAQELTTAYNSTSVNSGRTLLKSEYSQAKLLLKQIDSGVN